MAAESTVLLLSELDPSKRRVTVCVRVSHVWDYVKNGKLAHVDLVLIDEKANKMTAEIASGHAPKYKGLLQEGNVYLLRDFFVQSSNNMFRAVDERFMIKITPWTKINPKNDVPADFPYYAYSLTPFDLLPSLVGKKESFIDVLGIIIAIFDLLHVQLPGQSTSSVKRNLRLMDIDGRMVDVALWGVHASDFDGNRFCKEAQSKVLIVLLVGTLIKNYRGKDTISCGDAAKIYMDPDIPEKETYSTSIGQQIPVVKWIAAQEDQYHRAFHRSKPETVKIGYLLSTDPNEFLGKNMICTVTIMKIQPGLWWFLACSGCHRTAYPAGNNFTCSDQNYACISAEPRYKLRLIGSDGTGEAQFVFFAQVADQIIGKKIDALLRTVAHRTNVIPAEITALVSQKYTLNVSINERGLQYGDLSFQVNNIEVVHPRSRSLEFKLLASTSKQQTGSSMDIVPVESLSVVQPGLGSDLGVPNADDTTNVNLQFKGNEISMNDDSNIGTESAETIVASLVPVEVSNTPPSASRHGNDAVSVGEKQTRKRPGTELKKPSAAKRLFKEGDKP